jgi:uncharacterized membrane protein
MESSDSQNKPASPDELPFVAPCKKLDTWASLRWLRTGWQDIKRAPKQSLTYGFIMLLISYFISAVTLLVGDVYLFSAMLSGFILMGPVLAIGLYSISCQLQKNIPPVLGYCLREGRRHIGNEIIFAAILLVVFLVWARAAAMLHVFFPVQVDPAWEDLLMFLGIGSAVGAIFAVIIFSTAAFSLPMIMDKKVDMVTAIVTSINAVLRNKLPMFIWACIIVACVLLGFLTAFIGLVVLLPLIGHATWHGYQETIDASQWSDHD